MIEIEFKWIRLVKIMNYEIVVIINYFNITLRQFISIISINYDLFFHLYIFKCILNVYLCVYLNHHKKLTLFSYN